MYVPVTVVASAVAVPRYCPTATPSFESRLSTTAVPLIWPPIVALGKHVESEVDIVPLRSAALLPLLWACEMLPVKFTIEPVPNIDVKTALRLPVNGLICVPVNVPTWVKPHGDDKIE